MSMSEPNLDALAAELHAQIQHATTTPAGVAAFPGGDALLGVVIAKLKTFAVPELRRLLEFLKAKLDAFEAAAPAQVPAGHPTTE